MNVETWVVIGAVSTAVLSAGLVFGVVKKLVVRPIRDIARREDEPLQEALDEARDEINKIAKAGAAPLEALRGLHTELQESLGKRIDDVTDLKRTTHEAVERTLSDLQEAVRQTRRGVRDTPDAGELTKMEGRLSRRMNDIKSELGEIRAELVAIRRGLSPD